MPIPQQSRDVALNWAVRALQDLGFENVFDTYVPADTTRDFENFKKDMENLVKRSCFEIPCFVVAMIVVSYKSMGISAGVVGVETVFNGDWDLSSSPGIGYQHIVDKRGLAFFDDYDLDYNPPVALFYKHEVLKRAKYDAGKQRVIANYPFVSNERLKYVCEYMNKSMVAAGKMFKGDDLRRMLPKTFFLWYHARDKFHFFCSDVSNIDRDESIAMLVAMIQVRCHLGERWTDEMVTQFVSSALVAAENGDYSIIERLGYCPSGIFPTPETHVIVQDLLLQLYFSFKYPGLTFDFVVERGCGDDLFCGIPRECKGVKIDFDIADYIFFFKTLGLTLKAHLVLTEDDLDVMGARFYEGMPYWDVDKMLIRLCWSSDDETSEQYVDRVCSQIQYIVCAPPNLLEKYVKFVLVAAQHHPTLPQKICQAIRTAMCMYEFRESSDVKFFWEGFLWDHEEVPQCRSCGGFPSRINRGRFNVRPIGAMEDGALVCNFWCEPKYVFAVPLEYYCVYDHFPFFTPEMLCVEGSQSKLIRFPAVEPIKNALDDAWVRELWRWSSPHEKVHKRLRLGVDYFNFFDTVEAVTMAFSQPLDLHLLSWNVSRFLFWFDENFAPMQYERGNPRTSWMTCLVTQNVVPHSAQSNGMVGPKDQDMAKKKNVSMEIVVAAPRKAQVAAAPKKRVGPSKKQRQQLVRREKVKRTGVNTGVATARFANALLGKRLSRMSAYADMVFNPGEAPLVVCPDDWANDIGVLRQRTVVPVNYLQDNTSGVTNYVSAILMCPRMRDHVFQLGKVKAGQHIILNMTPDADGSLVDKMGLFYDSEAQNTGLANLPSGLSVGNQYNLPIRCGIYGDNAGPVANTSMILPSKVQTTAGNFVDQYVYNSTTVNTVLSCLGAASNGDTVFVKVMDSCDTSAGTLDVKCFWVDANGAVTYSTATFTQSTTVGTVKGDYQTLTAPNGTVGLVGVSLQPTLGTWYFQEIRVCITPGSSGSAGNFNKAVPYSCFMGQNCHDFATLSASVQTCRMTAGSGWYSDRTAKQYDNGSVAGCCVQARCSPGQITASTNSDLQMYQSAYQGPHDKGAYGVLAPTGIGILKLLKPDRQWFFDANYLYFTSAVGGQSGSPSPQATFTADTVWEVESEAQYIPKIANHVDSQMHSAVVTELGSLSKLVGENASHLRRVSRFVRRATQRFVALSGPLALGAMASGHPEAAGALRSAAAGASGIDSLIGSLQRMF